MTDGTPRIGTSSRGLAVLAALATGLVLWLASGADPVPSAPPACKEAARAAVPGGVGSRDPLARPEARVAEDSVLPGRPLDSARPARQGAGASLSIQVSTERGAPLPGVRIDLYQDGRVARRAVCDDDGIALATGMGEGAVGIAPVRESLPLGTLPPPPLHGVGREDGGLAVCRRVDLESGEQTEVRLVLQTAARVEGRISREDGTPLENVSITLLALDASIARRVAHTDTDAQGIFSIEDLAPGRHLLKGATTEAGATRSLPVEFVLAAGDSRWLDVPVSRWSGRVRGAVRDAGGMPVEGVALRVVRGSTPVATGSTGADGLFAFEALPRTLLRLELAPGASAGSGLFGLRSVRSGFAPQTVDLRSSDVDVGEVLVDRPLRFTLRGRIDAADPRAHRLRASATYVHPDGSEGHTIVLPVDEQGSFLFECEESVHGVHIEASDARGHSATLDFRAVPGVELQRVLHLQL